MAGSNSDVAFIWGQDRTFLLFDSRRKRWRGFASGPPGTGKVHGDSPPRLVSIPGHYLAVFWPEYSEEFEIFVAIADDGSQTAEGITDLLIRGLELSEEWQTEGWARD